MQVTVPNLWTLPFRAGHFDVISARSLYELLKTTKPVPAAPQMSTISASRSATGASSVVASLISPSWTADVIHAGVNAQKTSVEFGFSLKTARLRRAAYQDVHAACVQSRLQGRAASLDGSSHGQDSLELARRAQRGRQARPTGERESLRMERLRLKMRSCVR